MAPSYPSSRCRQRWAAIKTSMPAPCMPAPSMPRSACGGGVAMAPSLLQVLAGLSQQLGQLQALLIGEPAPAPYSAPHRPPCRRVGADSYSAQDAWLQEFSDEEGADHAWPDSAWPDEGSADDPLADDAWADDPWGRDSWDTPWDELSVVELRSLLRCYPIDRTTLPAPIERLRRHELLTALHQLQPPTP
jgi:hypothetical protein